MSLQFVDSCRIYPGRCSVMPHVGGNHAWGYVDSGTTNASGERVYVSVVAAVAMAEALGFKRAGDESDVRAENEALNARVAELEARLATAEEGLGAVQVLKQTGFSQTRPPGRPRKVVA